MSYVDALYSRDRDEIQIVERINGQRVYNTLTPNYTFYYEDIRGNHKTMWGKPCTKVVSNNYKTFQKELRSNNDRKIHESDINPIFRCLEENYLGVEPPKLNIAFFDIETDFDPKKGFASPWDPFARITAISVYQSQTNQLHTVVLKPDVPERLPNGDMNPIHLSWDRADAIANKFENCVLCNDEEELLERFVDLVEDSDILTGWNSTSFDIPYVVNRIERTVGKQLSQRLCLWNQRPKKREFTKYKKKSYTYDLVGRVHLDYLDLYKKNNQQELHSYRLDFVGEIEVKENKIPYEGTLDMLYKQDFEKFIAYNRQDTALLYKIDAKCKYIELANQIAHTNSVLLPNVMGTVALIEQAIVNEAHARGMVVPNRRSWAEIAERAAELEADADDEDADEEMMTAVGAYVADPKTGIHSHIGCVDINSLYPSALRSLNMGPETLVGQIRSDRTDALIAERIKKGATGPTAWHNIFCLLEFDIVQQKSEEMLMVDFEDGSTMEITGKDLYEFIYEQGNPYVLSANGTIFRTDVEAIIPGLLARWYSERQKMQRDEKNWKDLANGIEIPDDLAELLQ